ncbi:MAG: hypothetical protein HKL90_12775 [Elusimicrobia bacterium]|nr:hypothetical protein [Elusimicrobiota bacterium]
MFSTAAERFRAWTSAEVDGGGVRRFRIAFASIWLSYDVCDFLFKGTASCLALGITTPHTLRLGALQLALIAVEAGLLYGRRARLCAFSAFVLRAAEAYWFFPLNDFYYFSVVALILSQCRLEPGAPESAWSRDTLLLQMAWIYFSTALLKTSRVWLSGGHLFVRHAYLLASRGWPYPAPYRALVSTLTGNAILASLGVLGEFTMAALLVLRGPRRATVALCVALHGFAALTLNVWFFGASVVAQVVLLSAPDAPNTP